MNAIVGRRIVRLGSSGQPTSSKYRNKPTEVDGLRFDSKKEALRWRGLRLLESDGRIRNLVRQVQYDIVVGGKLICRYRADFEYEELTKGEWVKITEDVKGQPSGAAYTLFKMKKKLVFVLHGIDIRET